MRSSEIGGQAVIEGVMMKNKDKYAVAVRKPDKTIAVEVRNCGNTRSGFSKLPIIRGIFAFVDSLVLGIKTLTFSASFFDDEEEEKAEGTEKKPEKKSTDDNGKPESSTGDKLLIAGTVAFSIILSVAVFIMLPFFISWLLKKVIDSQTVLTVLEGVIRILLFIGYVAAISQVNDIKRVFRYHGAEHKTINCIEHGYDLTVENVRKQSKQHKRCGTSFMIIVIVISLIFFMFIRVDQAWLQALIRLALIPVIAGVAYEFIRLAGRSDSLFVRIVSQPGLWMQGMTTKEPDDSMIEVAIASVEAVFDWKPFVEQVRKENGEGGTCQSECASKATDNIQANKGSKASKNAAHDKERAKKAADEAARAEQAEKAAKKAAEREERDREARKEAEIKAEYEARLLKEREDMEARLRAEYEAKYAATAEPVVEASDINEPTEETVIMEETVTCERTAAPEKEAAEKKAAAENTGSHDDKDDLKELDKVLNLKKPGRPSKREEPTGYIPTTRSGRENHPVEKAEEPVKEEEDDVLKALDKFFTFDDDK